MASADGTGAGDPRREARGGDRYSRHRAIAGFSQSRLQASRYAVIGAGAIGNEVVKNLCLLGVGAIDVYDLDTVERHNLTRSVLLREADVGASKARAVAARARALDPAVAVHAIDGDVHDTLGPRAVRGYAAVIGALDNFEARLRVNLLCWLAGTDWVNAAIDARHASVESFPFGRAARAAADAAGGEAHDEGDGAPACYECGLPPSVYQRLAERRSCGGLARVAREQRIVPTTAITASVAGAMAVQQALSMPAASRRWLLDTASGHASTARIASGAADGACPVCSRAPPAARAATATHAFCAASELARFALAERAEAIEFPEPVVWHAECTNCGPTDATRAIVGRPARKVDETAAFCFGCGAEAVRIEMRDLVDPAALHERFGERPLPLAFVRVGPHLVDTTYGSSTPHTGTPPP
ncbi:MAG: ThiF family adenylyltransferase [Lautropia sp.]